MCEETVVTPWSAEIEMGSLRVRQHQKPQVQIKAPREMPRFPELVEEKDFVKIKQERSKLFGDPGEAGPW